MIKCWRTQKLSYNTWARATRAVVKTQRTGADRKDRRTLEAYQCKHCHMWHIGHSRRLAIQLHLKETNNETHTHSL